MAKQREALDDDWEKASLEEKLAMLGFESKGAAELFVEAALSVGQVKRLHDVLDGFAGAGSIVDTIDEETQGSDCEVCKRIQALLSETEGE